jgi:chromosome segregation ATPase
LIDFTQQFEAISTFSQRLSSLSSSRRSPTKSAPLLSHLQNQRSPRKAPATPLKNNNNILNLLDFELPPAPTPRSLPTITVRELESLKSSYASQISSLNATLSGRGAEVEALKRAVSDAERRVGEASESAREEKARRESVEKEKEEWERRGREFENVLKQVRAEVLESEKEKSDLAMRAEENEERMRDLERRLADSEARLLQADAAQSTAPVSTPDGPLFTAEQVQKQIDAKIHTLSTELHAIYKKKHITKVAGLKKGFEAKTATKTAELQSRIDDLEKANEDLQSKIDSTFSGTIVPTSSLSAEDRAKLEHQAVEIERQKAALAGREEELRSHKEAYAVAVAELEKERVEKGELVAAVDEMLALQADMSVLNAAGESQGTVEDVLRKSVAGAAVAAQRGAVGMSGLRGPGFGFASGHQQQQSKIGGLARPVGKSRMMSNIERMGGARGE